MESLQSPQKLIYPLHSRDFKYPNMGHHIPFLFPHLDPPAPIIPSQPQKALFEFPFSISFPLIMCFNSSSLSQFEPKDLKMRDTNQKVIEQKKGQVHNNFINISKLHDSQQTPIVANS